jgi:hypothetical protein
MPRGINSRHSLAYIVLALSLVIPKAQSQTHLTFTTVTVRGAIHSEVNGADGFGDIVGFYIDANHVVHGFKDVAGKITTINFPGATGTRATGIDLNDIFIVGWYTDSKHTPHGFRLTAGQFTTVDVPNAAWTRALSVNSVG